MIDHAHVRLRQAKENEKLIIQNMLQRYLRELLEYIGMQVPPGPQPYPYLDAYWTEGGIAGGRVPFLILANGDVAGFAFRNEHSRLGHPGPTSSVAEFYIQPEHRRHDVGRHAARALFDRFPGRWEVAQIRKNTRARYFWRTVIDEYTSGAFEEHEFRDGSGREWVIDVFVAPDDRK